MNQSIREKLKKFIKLSIQKYLSQNNEIRHNILDYIFPRERKVHAVMNGLKTSMGTKVWEELARILAENNGFEIKNIKQINKPKPFPPQLKKVIQDLQDERNSENFSISLLESRDRIREVVQSIKIEHDFNFEPPGRGHGIDIYLIKNSTEYIFDLKTPHPNRGDGNRYNQQLIKWYAHRIFENPLVNLEARIAFTYDPYFPEQSFVEKEAKKIAPLKAGEDFWVGDEFWDFCSGYKNTWRTIESIFIEIGQDQSFVDKYRQYFY